MRKQKNEAYVGKKVVKILKINLLCRKTYIIPL